MQQNFSQTKKKLNEIFLGIIAQDIFILSHDMHKKSYKGLKNKNCYYASCFNDDPYGVVFALDQWPFRDRSFDLIVLDYHLSLAVGLNSLLNQIAKKLTDNGQIIIIDDGKFSSETLRRKISLITLVDELTNQGFERYQHYYITDDNDLLHSFLTILCPWLCTTFILHYGKKTIPLTPIVLGRTEKLFKDRHRCISIGNYNKVNPTKK